MRLYAFWQVATVHSMRILLTCFAAVIWSASALAVDFYVSKESHADDNNTCTTPAEPCETIQAAVNKTPIGVTSHVFMAPGVYKETVSVHYWRFVGLRGDCEDWSAVTVEPPANAAGVRGQDHAIFSVACFTIASKAPGSVGLLSRQFTIVDLDRMRFSVPIVMSAQEGSRINCADKIEVFGNMDVFGTASDHSTLAMNCNVAFTGDLAVAAHFFAASWLSLISAQGMTWSGPQITGKQFVIHNSTILTSRAGLPGSAAGDAHDNSTVK